MKTMITWKLWWINQQIFQLRFKLGFLKKLDKTYQFGLFRRSVFNPAVDSHVIFCFVASWRCYWLIMLMLILMAVESWSKEGWGIPCFAVKTRWCVRQRCIRHGTPSTQVGQWLSAALSATSDLFCTLFLSLFLKQITRNSWTMQDADNKVHWGKIDEVVIRFLHVIAGTAIALLSHRNSVRLSVCPSVRLSHEWTSQKRCKLGSPNLHCQLPGRL